VVGVGLTSGDNGTLAIQPDVLAAVYLRAVDIRGEETKIPTTADSPEAPLRGFLAFHRPLSSHIDGPQIHHREYVGL